MVVMAATWRDWGITRTCGGRGVPGGGRGKALSELKLNPLCSNHLLVSILFYIFFIYLFYICFTFIFIIYYLLFIIYYLLFISYYLFYIYFIFILYLFYIYFILYYTRIW